MRSFGAPRSWPPDAGREIANLLGKARGANTRRNEEPRLTMLASLGDTRGWLEDHRPYHNRHEASWKSVCRDVNDLLAARGPRLTAQTPALTALTNELAPPGLGRSLARRGQALELLDAGLRELGETKGPIAAFMDLSDAVADLDLNPEAVARRLDFLSAALEAGSRSLAAECLILAGVVDDSLYEVELARRELDGAPAPGIRASMDADAGLDWSERLELCRRWLSRPLQGRHHVVWLGYSQAKCFWQIEVGNVTFFDGPALLSVLDQLEEDPTSAAADHMPPELSAGSELTQRDHHHWPTELERWVAVRIDLGTGLFVDPVSTARSQAEALVKWLITVEGVAAIAGVVAG